MPFTADPAGNLTWRPGSGGPGEGLYAAGRAATGPTGAGWQGLAVAGTGPVPVWGAIAPAVAGLPPPRIGGTSLPLFASPTSSRAAPMRAAPALPTPLRQPPLTRGTGPAGPFEPVSSPYPLAPPLPPEERPAYAVPGFSSLPSSSTAPIAAFPLPPDLTRVGPRPALVPAGWVPPQALAPAFYGPGGAAPAGLREPFGGVGPDAIRDLLFQVTGYDRSWGEPPTPSGSLYAGMVWSPDRVLFEPQATMPPDHWYRRLNAEGVYVQAYKGEDAPSVWRYRYVRAGNGIPDLTRPYTVLGGLSDLYREQEIRTYEAQNQARGKAIAAYLYDSNENRMRRGESSPNLNQDYVVPEKYKAMEIKKAPVLLEMPMWTVINKASVTKMYKDAGLPVPTFPGEAAVASSQAFQEFKDTRGHVASKPQDFWYAEEQERQARVAARKEVEAEQEQARLDAIKSDERARLGAQGLGAVGLPFAGDAPPGIPPAAARGLLALRGESAFDKGERRRELLHDLVPWGEGGRGTTVTERDDEVEVLEVHDLDEPIEPESEPEPESTAPKAKPPSSTKTSPRPPSRPTPPPTTGVPRTGDAVVPDLLRKRWGEAKQLLKDFSPAVSGPGSDDAVVWSQHPTPGVKALIGSPVLAITTTFDGRENRGRAPGPLPTTGTDGLVSMPDVRLLPLEEAMKRLAGFVVSVKGTDGPGAVVVTQVPAARVRVDRSAKVVLAVGALGRTPDGASFPGLGTGVAPSGGVDPKPTRGPTEGPCEFFERMKAWATRHPGESVSLAVPPECRGPGATPGAPVARGTTESKGSQAPRPTPSQEKATTVRVPDVHGLSFGQADTLLRGVGLRADATPDSDRFDDHAVVKAQQPAPGTLLGRGKVVMLSIPSVYAVTRVLVPALIGKSVAAAIAALRAVGLEMRATGAGPLVTDQSPEATSSVPRGSTVEVKLGEVVAQVEVPDIRGLRYAEASRTMLDAGLVLRKEMTPRESVANSQSLPAGMRVPRGSMVSAQWDLVAPDVLGLAAEPALRAFRERGFKPEIQSDTAPGRSVVEHQIPAPGAHVYAGAPGARLILSDPAGRGFRIQSSEGDCAHLRHMLDIFESLTYERERRAFEVAVKPFAPLAALIDPSIDARIGTSDLDGHGSGASKGGEPSPVEIVRGRLTSAPEFTDLDRGFRKISRLIGYTGLRDLGISPFEGPVPVYDEAVQVAVAALEDASVDGCRAAFDLLNETVDSTTRRRATITRLLKIVGLCTANIDLALEYFQFAGAFPISSFGAEFAVASRESAACMHDAFTQADAFAALAAELRDVGRDDDPETQTQCDRIDSEISAVERAAQRGGSKSKDSLRWLSERYARAKSRSDFLGVYWTVYEILANVMSIGLGAAGMANTRANNWNPRAKGAVSTGKGSGGGSGSRGGGGGGKGQPASSLSTGGGGPSSSGPDGSTGTGGGGAGLERPPSPADHPGSTRGLPADAPPSAGAPKDPGIAPGGPHVEGGKPNSGSTPAAGGPEASDPATIRYAEPKQPPTPPPAPETTPQKPGDPNAAGIPPPQPYARGKKPVPPPPPGTSGEGAPRGEADRKHAPPPPPPPPPNLPPFKEGGKTTGVLRTEDGRDLTFLSGREGPASRVPRPATGTGFDAYTSTHVEGHAAWTMREQGIRDATLYINNPVICKRCTENLHRMLPEGARLRLVLPSGEEHVFYGTRP